jgi:hypothetical protein
MTLRHLAVIVCLLVVTAGCAKVGTTPAGQPGINSPPQIAGQPATSVAVGTAYSFRPTASDVNSDSLTFTVDNIPDWAAFNPATGELAGTPQLADVGVYAGIVIRVGDGTATTALATFSITVTTGSTGTGSATLNWTAPTLNTDGSPLTDLAGYWVFAGDSAQSLVRAQKVDDPLATQSVMTSLATGTHFFAVAAYNSVGVESVLSNVGSKSIP